MTEQQQQRILVEGVSDGVRWTANYIATGWTVDDRGFLHILGADQPRNIATYAPSHWGFVSRPVLDGEPNEREGQMNVVLDGAAVSRAIKDHQRRGGLS